MELPTVNKQNNTISFKGEIYPVTEDQLRVFEAILNKEGGIISANELKMYSKSDERPDRIIQRLPNPLKDFILAKPGRGGGYYLKTELE